MRINRYIIIEKDLKSLCRDHTVALSLMIIWLLLICSAIMTYTSWNKERIGELKAKTNFREQWESLHGNPHDAAHFGTYLFKPVNVLSFFDQGLNDYFGSTYRVEAHKQNELEHIKVADSDTVLRFGPLSFALILQVLVPLLLFYITSSSITGEKESGTWKMLLAQGMKPVTIAWQKVWSNYILTLIIILPLCLAFAVMVGLTDNMLLTRFLLLTACYLLYYFIIILVGVIVSARSNNSGNALVVLFMIWLLIFVVLPPVFTTMADKQNPLMSRATFKNNIEQGFLKGLNGHDPYFERGERNIKVLLLKYHVDSLSMLPVDAAGITMQMNEDYQNKVFEYYYGQVRQRLNRQQDFLNKTSVLNPFLAIKRISMTACGTDFYQHDNFYAQARLYRNELIRKLNMELAAHPVKAGSYRASSVFFKSIPDFEYLVPDAERVIRWQLLPIISLLIWVFFSAALLQIITKKL